MDSNRGLYPDIAQDKFICQRRNEILLKDAPSCSTSKVSLFFQQKYTCNSFEIKIYFKLNASNFQHSNQVNPSIDRNILESFQDSESLLSWGKDMNLLENTDVIERLIELETGMVNEITFLKYIQSLLKF